MGIREPRQLCREYRFRYIHITAYIVRRAYSRPITTKSWSNYERVSTNDVLSAHCDQSPSACPAPSCDARSTVRLLLSPGVRKGAVDGGQFTALLYHRRESSHTHVGPGTDANHRVRRTRTTASLQTVQPTDISAVEILTFQSPPLLADISGNRLSISARTWWPDKYRVGLPTIARRTRRANETDGGRPLRVSGIASSPFPLAQLARQTE